MLSSQEVLDLADDRQKVLYLNIVVHDATEAVEAKVKQKLKKSSLLRVVANRAARAASGIASPPVIASMLGEKLPQKIAQKMEEKGIQCQIHEAFREGPYIVFQIQVVKVDAVVLAKSKSGNANGSGGVGGVFAMGNWIGVGFGLMGTNTQQWVEEGYLPKIVQKKLETIIPELLAEKLEKENLVAETYVLGEQKQARYFFAKHREIQSQKPAGFSNRIRNSNSSSSSLSLSSRRFKRSSSSSDADLSGR